VDLCLKERIEVASSSIQQKLKIQPEVVLILGSGFAGLAAAINAHLCINYQDIPNFKSSGAPGHLGRLVFGQLAGVEVACMQGRLHFYEGNSPEDIVFPLQVMQHLGTQSLIVTNAAGAINCDFQVGDIMMISDHINMTGASPLTIGDVQDLRDFVDMSYAYTPALRDLTRQVAKSQGLTLREGVYLGLRGPNFETPAEIRAYRSMGADAVGMSTVFEVIQAAQLKMKVLGLSLVTNMAAGILDQPLSLDEVTATAKHAAASIDRLIHGVLGQLK
jgi:purine-nucleoside phosphorylase